MEMAVAVVALIKEGGMDSEKVAAVCHRPIAWVTEQEEILSWPDDVQKAVPDGCLPNHFITFVTVSLFGATQDSQRSSQHPTSGQGSLRIKLQRPDEGSALLPLPPQIYPKPRSTTTGYRSAV